MGPIYHPRSPWGEKKGGLRILHVQPHRFQGVQLICCYSQIVALCVIGQIIDGGGGMGIADLGFLLLVVELVTAVSGYS